MAEVEEGDMPGLPKGEIWYLPSPEGEGTFVYNGHPRSACKGHSCALHDPSYHQLSEAPLRWMYEPGDGGYMERLCEHGNWHQDPDDLDYHVRVNGGDNPRPMELGRGCPCECRSFCRCRWMPEF